MATALFRVKAVYDYASQEADDLSFPLGQIITVTEEIDADWYEGEYTDVTGIKKSGIFPNNFVEKYEPEVPRTRPSRPVKDATPSSTIASPPTAAISSPPLPAESANSAQHAPVQALPPPVAQQKAPEPAQQTAEPPASTEAKKPPPVAPKSNAFKDRIAAFNAPAAAPILPFAPGRAAPSNFIKKPFVAPPPSRDAYIPQPKTETVTRPYVREEDPEIRQRQEEDMAAAQHAGLTNEDSADGEDAPKPQSLKDRIALLQKQQMEQAQRRAAPAPPTKHSQQDSTDAVQGEDDSEPHRPSVETRERPQVPPTPREPPTSPPIPQHEILSGGEEADQSAAETTEDDAGTIGPDDSDDRPLPPTPGHALQHSEQVGEVEEADDETEVPEEQEEDDMDEETRRKLELRERMAKMSGGMGMAGMFGPPGGMAMPGMSAVKKAPPREKKSTEDSVTSSASAPRVPMPGIQRVLSPEAENDTDDEPPRQASIDARRSLHEARGAPPPIPADRPAPQPAVPKPPPRSAVPPTPPIPQAALQDSDDEDVAGPLATSAETPRVETPLSRAGRPQDARNSYFSEQASDRRASRAPQVPSGAPLASPRIAPPPPPPAAKALNDEDGDVRGESEYEGDYDTDIASSAKHKDALRAHNRDPSYDDSTTADEAPLSPPSVPDRGPPVPLASRAAPPPPPAQAPVVPSRQSMDLPRAPPPAPPPRASTTAGDDDDYDPYRYSQGRAPPPAVPQASAPPVPPRVIDEEEESSDDLYSAPLPRKSMDRAPPPPPTQTAPQDRVPPPPPQTTAAALQPPPRVPPRQSLDIQGRRSMDQTRSTAEDGQIAGDIELSQDTTWWTEAQPLPPVFQGRNGVDLIFECEETSTSKRGGRTTISKDIYILFIDYSQTIITARYDSREPADVSLEQRHEPSPGKLRQDQLESFWEQFGRHIADAANGFGNSKKETTVGDGTATSLVLELIKAQPEALLPVGTRAYGALVYANLANASVMQFDEIRPGDIVTLRNAKFEGKHSGPMHQKYKQELGPSHVAIVNEWDGTKKKIRAWEQGREKKAGLKSESYRLGDLKSGEVRVWRVVGRQWVGWDSNA